MKSLIENFGKEVFKLFIFIGLTIGVPVYMLMARYPIYETVANNPLTNRITAVGLLITIIVLPLTLFIIKARISAAQPKLLKRLFWGLCWSAWLFVAYKFFSWGSENVEFAKDMFLYWAISMTFAFTLAPQFIIDYMQKKS